jgi:predicted DNA-binding transcriptional regulator AlpA
MNASERNNPVRRWVRVKQVAYHSDEHGNQVLGILPFSVATVWRLTAKKRLPQPLRFDGSTFWDVAELAAFIQARKAAV